LADESRFGDGIGGIVGSMPAFSTLPFLFLTILLSYQSFAQPTNPPTWNVSQGEVTTLHGVFLVDRSGDSISVLTRTGEVEVPIDSLLWVEKIVGRKSGVAIPIGIVGGAALGWLLSSGLSSDASASDLGDEGGIPAPIVGGVIGGGVGGIVGGMVGTGDETERISLR